MELDGMVVMLSMGGGERLIFPFLFVLRHVASLRSINIIYR